MELEKLISVTFGFASFAVMLIDAAYLERMYFPRAYKNAFSILIKTAGLFSLFYALAALSPKSAVFFTNIAKVFQLFWVYNYLKLLLANFNPEGDGSMEGNIIKAGEVLEEAKFPDMKNAPCFIPCAGGTSYIPNSRWLHQCIYRVKLYVYFTIVVVVATQVFDDHDSLYTEDGEPKTANSVLGYVSVFMVLVALSGFKPVDKLLQIVVLPERHHNVVGRARMCFLFFSWIGGIQNLIFALAGVHQKLSYAIINVEMFVFQLCCHRYCLPMFTWSFTSPQFGNESEVREQYAGFKFVIPVHEMAAAVAKARTDDDQTNVNADGDVNNAVGLLVMKREEELGGDEEGL